MRGRAGHAGPARARYPAIGRIEPIHGDAAPYAPLPHDAGAKQVSERLQVGGNRPRAGRQSDAQERDTARAQLLAMSLREDHDAIVRTMPVHGRDDSDE